jgi:hypothetical protein
MEEWCCASECCPNVWVVNMAALAAAAKPLRPTPAMPASPPTVVSGSGKSYITGEGECEG